MTSPDVIFTICRRTTASPYHVSVKIPIILEVHVPATDKIHIEDRYGLAWTKSNNGIYNTQNSQLIRT